MAKRKANISEEQAYSLYSSIYDVNREKILTYQKDIATGEISSKTYALYYRLDTTKYKPDQVIPAARAFGRSDYNKKLRAYEEALDAWNPFDGEPKPKKPHRDSLERYIKKMANQNTRQLSSLQAQSINKSGKFLVPVPIIDEETGLQKIDETTGELMWEKKSKRITKEQLYYSSQEYLDQYVWNPIRQERARLIEENKAKGEEALTDVALSKYLAHEISERFFFGSK